MRILLNFFVDESREKKYKEHLIDIQSFEEMNEKGFQIVFIFIHRSDKRVFMRLLKLLTNNIYYLIWFHLGKKIGGHDYEGSVALKDFKQVIPNLRPYFLSTSKNPLKVFGGFGKDEIKIYHFTKIKNYLEQIAQKGQLLPYNNHSLFAKPNKIDFPYQLDLKGDAFKHWLFERAIDKTDLQVILKNVLPENASKAKVLPLKPGFSGAHVFSVRFQIGGLERKIVVKIDRNEENLKKETVIKAYAIGSKLPKNSNITAHQTKGPLSVNNWFVLSFDMIEENFAPLKSKLGISQRKLKKTYSELLFKGPDDFKEKMGEVDIVESKCWQSSDPEKYEGLTIYENTLINIKKSIKEVTDTLHFFKPKSEEFTPIAKNDRELLFGFIDGNRKLGEEIEKVLINIPIARVHGDFHTDNIFVDDDNMNFRFIDFAFFSEENNKHAFLDLGKLSVDTELNIVGNQQFLLNPNAGAHLLMWIENHQNWINHWGNWQINKNKWIIPSRKTFQVAKDKFPKFRRLLGKGYAINDLMLSYVKFYKDSLKSKKPTIEKREGQLIKELTQQFFLVRLHYLLKYIGYSNILIHKKYFAIQASLQILHYFQERNNMKNP